MAPMTLNSYGSIKRKFNFNLRLRSSRFVLIASYRTWTDPYAHQTHLHTAITRTNLTALSQRSSSGNNLTELPCDLPGGRRDSECMTFWGLPPTKFGRAKTCKIRRDVWQLSTLIANIAVTDRRDENPKSTWTITSHPLLGEENWNFGLLTKSYMHSCWPTHVDLLHFDPYGVLIPQIFYMAYQHPKLYF